MNIRVFSCFTGIAAFSLATAAPAPADDDWPRAMTFLATFDGGTDAAHSVGEAHLYTVVTEGEKKEAAQGLRTDGKTAIIADAGLGGSGALQFTKRDAPWLFYKAEDNVAYARKDWAGTVSVWLRLDSAELDPGHNDPVQLTTRAWNDGAFFIDFDKAGNPRDFRLGVFPDLAVWNPGNKEVPDEQRPLLKVRNPPFSGDQWTHIAFTWEHFNNGDDAGVATFYLNGKRQGQLKNWNQTFTWKDDEEKRLYIGLNYQGLMDDLSCFNRALSDEEIASVFSSKSGLLKMIPVSKEKKKQKPVR